MGLTSILKLVSLVNFIAYSIGYSWLQYGFDSSRTSYNPYESVITSQRFTSNSLVSLWSLSWTGSSSSQVLYVENVLVQGKETSVAFFGSDKGDFYAVDCNSGNLIWKRNIGAYSGSSCGSNTIGTGTAFVDIDSSSIYVVSSDGNLHRLLLSTGAYFSSSWPVKSIFEPATYQSYGAINMYLNTIYVTVASRCSDSTSFQGKVLSFEIDSVTNSIFTQSFSPSTSMNNGDIYNGASISGAGGVSICPASIPSIFVATEKAFGNGAFQYSGYGESILQLDVGLNMKYSFSPTIQNDNYDFTTTPVVLTPTNKCSQTLIATINRAGELYITTHDMRSLQKLNLISSSSSSDSGLSWSSPSFDSSNNLLFATTPENYMFAYELSDSCSLTLKWKADLQDGNTYFSSNTKGLWSSAVVAGGVVYSSCPSHKMIIAIDEMSGAVLWTSSDVFNNVRSPVTVANGMVLVLDSGSDGTSGKLIAYTLTPRTELIETAGADHDTDAAVGYSANIYDDSLTATTNDYRVTISGHTYDFYPLFSIGLTDSNGRSSNQGDTLQRIFTFEGESFTGKTYLYLFRVPIAGKDTVTLGMRNNGFSWTQGAPYTVDVYQCEPDLSNQAYLGVYDPTSWVVNGDGSVTVSYNQGQYNNFGSGCIPTFMATFKCGATAAYSYSFTETTRCDNRVTVSSSTFCATLSTGSTTPTRLPTPTPSTVPTRTPSRTPTTAPTGTPVTVPVSSSPTRIPTATPTSTPVASPTSGPTYAPISAPTQPPTPKPTSPPSLRPTALPSTFPTSSTYTREPTAVPSADSGIFNLFYIIIEGVSAADIGTKEIEAIVKTIADLCSVQTTRVSVTSITAGNRRLSEQAKLATVSSTVYFTIRKVVPSGETEDSLYAALASTLTDALNTGTFTSTLRDQAATIVGTSSPLATVGDVTFVNGLGFTTTAFPTGIPTNKPSLEPTVSFFPTAFPSVEPTVAPTISLQPTFVGQTRAPTRVPATKLPTLNPTGSGAVPSAAPVTVLPGGSCISLALLDSFGDGWDNARLMVFPSVGEPYALSPGCSSDVVTSFFCFTPDKYQTGDFVVIGVVGYKPSHSWEIFWQARNEADGTIFSGTYTTSMTFVYRKDSKGGSSFGSITMMNELPDELTCRSCEAHSSKTDENGFLNDVLFTSMTSSSSSSTETNEEISLLHRRPVGSLFDIDKKATNANEASPISVGLPDASDVEIGRGAIGGQISFALYGAQDTWANSEGYGTSFFIFDTSAQLLFYSGNLCGGGVSGGTGSCQVKLEAGQYVWRVSSSGGADVYWEFCGVKGDSKTELIFNWENNQCTPVKASAINQICKLLEAQAQAAATAAAATSTGSSTAVVSQDQEKTGSSSPSGTSGEGSNTATSSTSKETEDVAAYEVVLAGSLRLAGMSKVSLSETDEAVLREAIAHELTDSGPRVQVTTEQVRITSLAVYEKDLLVSFQVRINAEEFGVTMASGLGTSLETQMDAMAGDLRTYLHRSMASGIFLARVKAITASTGGMDTDTADSSNLEFISEIQMNSLYIDHNGQIYQTSYITRHNFMISVSIFMSVVVVALVIAFLSKTNENGVSNAEVYTDIPIRSLHEKFQEFTVQLGMTRSMAVSGV